MPGNGQGFAFRPLRGALDRMRLLYAVAVPSDRWRALVGLAESGAGVIVDHGDAPTPCEVYRQGPSIIVECDAFRAEVRAPLVLVTDDATVDTDDAAPRGRGGARRYAVELEVRGLACAESTNGIASVTRAREAIEELCWPGWAREALAGATFPGRFDICFDVAVTGPNASQWIEDTLFARGDIDAARAPWASRARSQRMEDNGADVPAPDDDGEGRHDRGRSVGTAKRGRTFYIGGGTGRSAPIELCLYEKDRLQNVGWQVLQHTLRTMGWDGAARVIRAEFRATREWLRDQTVTLDGKVRRGDRLTFDEFASILPLVARALWRRYRHTDGSATRVRRRDTSEFWRTAYTCATYLDGPGKLAPTQIRSVKRERTFSRARDALAGLYALWRAAGGANGAPVAHYRAHELIAYELLCVTSDPKRAAAIERKRVRAMLRLSTGGAEERAAADAADATADHVA